MLFRYQINYLKSIIKERILIKNRKTHMIRNRIIKMNKIRLKKNLV